MRGMYHPFGAKHKGGFPGCATPVATAVRIYVLRSCGVYHIPTNLIDHCTQAIDPARAAARSSPRPAPIQDRYAARPLASERPVAAAYRNSDAVIVRT